MTNPATAAPPYSSGMDPASVRATVAAESRPRVAASLAGAPIRQLTTP